MCCEKDDLASGGGQLGSTPVDTGARRPRYACERCGCECVSTRIWSSICEADPRLAEEAAPPIDE
eukprot:3520644-Alexandrium_andersonii.AAC.1